MNATRRLRYAALPAAFAMIALAGCQDEAPTAAAPSVAPTAAPTQAAPTSAPTAEDTPTSEEPTSEEPTTEASSSSSSEDSSDASGAVCDETGSYVHIPGVAPKPIGTKQTYSGDATLEVTAGKPTIDSTSTDSYFPGDGMVTISYPVTLKLTQGSYFVTSYLEFTLMDQSQNACNRDSSGTVVPKSKQLSVDSLHEGDTVSAQVVYAVPKGADYSKYQLLFGKDSSGKADLAWNGS